jgi:hypothetical protein
VHTFVRITLCRPQATCTASSVSLVFQLRILKTLNHWFLNKSIKHNNGCEYDYNWHGKSQIFFYILRNTTIGTVPITFSSNWLANGQRIILYYPMNISHMALILPRKLSQQYHCFASRYTRATYTTVKNSLEILIQNFFLLARTVYLF